MRNSSLGKLLSRAGQALKLCGLMAFFAFGYWFPTASRLIFRRGSRRAAPRGDHAGAPAAGKIVTSTPAAHPGRSMQKAGEL